MKIGVLGVGHLGKIHIKCLKELELFELSGFFDPDDKAASQAESTYHVRRFKTYEDLLQEVDAVDIVAPTSEHFHLAVKAIERNKHVFMEKPLTTNLEEAEILKDKIKGSSLKFQIGHVERFNPAYLSLADMPVNPVFIEGHRLAEFNPRGTDVSVVLDLMIHDIDLILTLVKSKVKQVHANGVKVLSNSPDICNARIEFENGCVVNLTASRISVKQMRKLRIFQKNAYISLDFLERKSEIFRLYDPETEEIPDYNDLLDLDTPNGVKKLRFIKPSPPKVNAILKELETFYHTINEDMEPLVGIEAACDAMELAHLILRQVEQNKISV